MPLYALIDMTPNDDNLFPVVNLETRSTKPPEINGHRWLTDKDFAEGAVVNIGLFWTGGLPAEFVEKPAVEVPADAPGTIEEAWARVTLAEEAAAAAKADLARILGVN